MAAHMQAIFAYVNGESKTPPGMTDADFKAFHDEDREAFPDQVKNMCDFKNNLEVFAYPDGGVAEVHPRNPMTDKRALIHVIKVSGNLFTPGGPTDVCAACSVEANVWELKLGKLGRKPDGDVEVVVAAGGDGGDVPPHAAVNHRVLHRFGDGQFCCMNRGGGCDMLFASRGSANKHDASGKCQHRPAGAPPPLTHACPNEGNGCESLFSSLYNATLHDVSGACQRRPAGAPAPLTHACPNEGSGCGWRFTQANDATVHDVSGACWHRPLGAPPALTHACPNEGKGS
jgi:hypothetical protein